MDDLIAIILGYESDTFNARAQQLTQHEAKTMAEALFIQLCYIVQQRGSMACDGVRLAEMLEEIRAA